MAVIVAASKNKHKIEEIEGNRGGGIGSSGLTKKVKENVEN